MSVNKSENKSNRQPRISVEYAHIYTDQQFSSQQEAGVRQLRAFMAEQPVGSDITKVVLIDDYSPGLSRTHFDARAFIAELERLDAAPDVVVAESALLDYCAQTLALVGDKKIKKQLTHYYKSRQKYPCSLFVAAWYLVRLGAFGTPKLDCVAGRPEMLLADELATILPDSFTTPEEQAMEIIKSTPHAALADGVRLILFEYMDSEYSDWQEFGTEEYVRRNYGKMILPEDQQIIDFAVKELAALGVAPNSLAKVADIGAGPNLYPSLLISPYVKPDGRLDVVDFVQANLEYQKKVLCDGDAEGLETWDKFEMYMQNIGHNADMAKVRRVANVMRGSVFEQPQAAYDAIMSFFVTDSITDDKAVFDQATASLVGALKPNGIFIVAHMVGSRGYFAGERAFFPAVNLSIDDIEAEYQKYGTFKSHLVTHDNQPASRKGYKGMAVLVGKKHA